MEKLSGKKGSENAEDDDTREESLLLPLSALKLKDLPDKIKRKFEDFQCPICLDTIIEATAASCNGYHKFCSYCINRCMQLDNRRLSFRCPVCRCAIVATTVLPKLDEEISKLFQSLSVEIQNERAKALDDRRALPTVPTISDNVTSYLVSGFVPTVPPLPQVIREELHPANFRFARARRLLEEDSGYDVDYIIEQEIDQWLMPLPHGNLDRIDPESEQYRTLQMINHSLADYRRFYMDFQVDRERETVYTHYDPWTDNNLFGLARLTQPVTTNSAERVQISSPPPGFYATVPPNITHRGTSPYQIDGRINPSRAPPNTINDDHTIRGLIAQLQANGYYSNPPPTTSSPNLFAGSDFPPLPQPHHQINETSRAVYQGFQAYRAGLPYYPQSLNLRQVTPGYLYQNQHQQVGALARPVQPPPTLINRSYNYAAELPYYHHSPPVQQSRFFPSRATFIPQSIITSQQTASACYVSPAHSHGINGRCACQGPRNPVMSHSPAGNVRFPPVPVSRPAFFPLQPSTNRPSPVQTVPTRWYPPSAFRNLTRTTTFQPVRLVSPPNPPRPSTSSFTSNTQTQTTGRFGGGWPSGC